MTKDLLPELANCYISNKVKKISGKGVFKTGKGLTSLISNEDMDDIITLLESLERSGLLIDGSRETIEHEIKNKMVDFVLLWCRLYLLH